MREGGLYLDGTFGGGGYSRALLARGARVVALDRDPAAIAGGAALAAAHPDRLTLVAARFSGLDQHAQSLDGVVLDIGVSSMQIDEPARGFSLRFDADLDMRMEGSGRSAADLLAEASEAELADIFFHFGEERAASMHRYAYFPFLGGPRQCIGMAFAMMETVLCLGTLVRRLCLSLAPGWSVTPEPLLSLRPKGGLPMTATLR